MGTGSSKHWDDGSSGGERDSGGQLYVSLRMENWNNSELIPHIYGSVPIIGSWDSSKAVLFLIFSLLRFISLLTVSYDPSLMLFLYFVTLIVIHGKGFGFYMGTELRRPFQSRYGDDSPIQFW